MGLSMRVAPGGLIVFVLLAVMALLAPASGWARGLAARPAAGDRGADGLRAGQAECSSWPGSICYYAFINDTPYPMNLVSDKAWYGYYKKPHGYVGAPVTTLQPETKEVFSFKEDEEQWIEAGIAYQFTDVDGQRHEADYNIDSNGNPWATSNDFNAAGQEVQSTATFHMAHDPDGYPNDIDAVLSHPAVVTYDARTQVAQATAIMANWNQGTDRDFTLLSGPTYQNSVWTRASAVVENTTNEPATLTLTGTDSHEESTSIGASVTWSSELGFFGLANQKVSATLSGGHQWSTTDKLIQSHNATVPPGDVGCLFDSASMATVTGDFTLTLSGITYHINNVTITDPAQAASGPAVTFTTGRGKIGQPCLRVQAGAQQGAGNEATSRGSTAKSHRHGSKPKHHKGAGKGSTNPGGHQSLALVGPAGAPLLSGTPVAIDASKDPQQAGDAMSHWDQATNKQFVLTSNPLYTNSPTLSGDAQYTPKTDGPEQYSLNVEHDYSSQWSVGGSFSAETKLGIIGFANASLAVTVTASHEWTTEHDENQGVTATVDPGYRGWIQMYTGQVTITGNYSFTYNGTDYQINNVTITEPDNSPPDQPQGPYTATVFTVVQQPQTGQAAQR